ncbi:mitochondrial nicotinamide adenine dinucleotide transporter SLC25A51 [Teleopsis dalmanni]|uniref:mitochondrial nicotinamide adenine dinucleotide transporter SLC25A51 n=1 Tax=Teleopsis dalmanni TaxID=139649 RepID=UPI0018CFC276|nr:mitochondrial nicotinamide adenine dinucleotide transporter SLC25A51 [Teleopsis dalmanni]
MVIEKYDEPRDDASIPLAPPVFPHDFLESFDAKEFICGCGAAFVNITVSYPIYKMIFRQMLHGVHITSAFGQLRHEGIGYLYRGMFPPLAQKTISLSLMFGVFDGTRRYFVDKFNMNLYAAKVLAGIASGSVEAALMPFERVQTLLAHSKFHGAFANTPAAFRYIWVNHGFLELYRGLVPVLWRNGPSNALFFMMREEAIKYLPQRNSMTKKTVQEFVAGAIIGASISTLFYPLNVIKVAMQSEMGQKPASMWMTSKRIYYERGGQIKYFYRGCMFNSCRSFLSWGIMNTAYETLKKLVS